MFFITKYLSLTKCTFCSTKKKQTSWNKFSPLPAAPSPLQFSFQLPLPIGDALNTGIKIITIEELNIPEYPVFQYREQNSIFELLSDGTRQTGGLTLIFLSAVCCFKNILYWLIKMWNNLSYKFWTTDRHLLKWGKTKNYRIYFLTSPFFHDNINNIPE